MTDVEIFPHEWGITMKKLILLSITAVIFSTTAYAQTLPRQHDAQQSLSRVRGATMIAPDQQVPRDQQLQVPVISNPDTSWDAIFNKPKDQNSGG